MIRFLIIGLKCLMQSLWLTFCYVFEAVFWMLIGKDYKFVKIPLSKTIFNILDFLWDLADPIVYAFWGIFVGWIVLLVIGCKLG